MGIFFNLQIEKYNYFLRILLGREEDMLILSTKNILKNR